MATEIVENDPTWRAGFDHESARERFDRKFAQAESLAHSLTCNDFTTFNSVIQQNVMWLLGDLLTEAREALEASERKVQQ